MCENSPFETIADCAAGSADPLSIQDEGPRLPSGFDAEVPPGARTLYHTLALEFAGPANGGGRLAPSVSDGRAPVRRAPLSGRQGPEPLTTRYRHLRMLIEKARQLEPLRTAVVAPEEEHALKGALLAAEMGLIEPVLVGNRLLIEQAANAAGCKTGGYEIVEADTAREAAAKAVQTVVEGHAQSLMKGNLHTDALLHEVLKKNKGLRGSRRLSHVFVMDVPDLDHLLLISDAAINVAPTLEDKADITQNAIDLALSLGIKEPRAGILSAVETVTPKIPSTLDAAILSKMAERGQIKGGVVDGPLAMDNAIDMEAARTKGITSMVAGRADILIVPNLEAGNMLAKELTFVAHAGCAGIVLGARVPIILTSRADNEEARLASCAVAALYRAAQATNSAPRCRAA